MRIAVYTAIFGNKDELLAPLKFKNSENINYYCYTDNLNLKSDIYKIIFKKKLYLNHSKNARFFKIVIPEELLNYDLIIWHDGNIQIKDNKVLDLYKLSLNSDLLLFTHPHRNCVYEESKACIKRNKDSYFIIFCQILKYFLKRLPTQSGLFETGILVRRNVSAYDKIYREWWIEIDRFSSRDQLSLGYIFWYYKIIIGCIEGSGSDNEYSVYHSHTIKNKIDSGVINIFFGKINKMIIIYLISVLQLVSFIFYNK